MKFPEISNFLGSDRENLSQDFTHSSKFPATPRSVPLVHFIGPGRQILENVNFAKSLTLPFFRSEFSSTPVASGEDFDHLATVETSVFLRTVCNFQDAVNFAKSLIPPFSKSDFSSMQVTSIEASELEMEFSGTDFPNTVYQNLGKNGKTNFRIKFTS